MSGIVTVQHGRQRYLRIPRDEIRSVTCNVRKEDAPNCILVGVHLSSLRAPMTMAWSTTSLVVVGDKQVQALAQFFDDLIDMIEVDIRWEMVLPARESDHLRWRREEHRR